MVGVVAIPFRCTVLVLTMTAAAATSLPQASLSQIVNRLNSEDDEEEESGWLSAKKLCAATIDGTSAGDDDGLIVADVSLLIGSSSSCFWLLTSVVKY